MKLDFARNDEMKYCKDVEYDDGDDDDNDADDSIKGGLDNWHI